VFLCYFSTLFVAGLCYLLLILAGYMVSQILVRRENRTFLCKIPLHQLAWEMKSLLTSYALYLVRIRSSSLVLFTLKKFCQCWCSTSAKYDFSRCFTVFLFNLPSFEISTQHKIFTST